MGLLGILVGVAVIVLVAYLLGSGGGPFGRYAGEAVRRGRLGGPLGDEPGDPNRDFAKPHDDNELL